MVLVVLFISMHICFLLTKRHYNAGESESVATKPRKEKETKSLKEKTSKAERRAIQEAQRAAKAAAKGSCFFNICFVCFQ